MDKSHSDIVWFKLDRTFFRIQKDLFICFVYISPKNSSYTIRTNCDKHIFEKLEGDITKYSIIGDVMIMGDINVHVNASEQDYICNEVDDVLDNFLPSNYIADNIKKSHNTEVPQITNEYGRSVIDLCTEAQLRILNGRTIDDSSGKSTLHTYNGVSIDDYCICNSDFLPNILSFRVGQFQPLLSDHSNPSSGLQKPILKSN